MQRRVVQSCPFQREVERAAGSLGTIHTNHHRAASLLIELIDKPGQLKEISSIIADCGGNVTGVHYEKGNTESINGCFLRIEMETRDNNHVKTIKNALREAGFRTTKG